MIKKDDKIFVTGHNGLVGSAVLRALQKKKFKNIITISRKDLDLFDQKKVNLFLFALGLLQTQGLNLI